jgi:hypothetical protein
MAKSIEQTVAELADREAIRELPLKYCDCVWRGDIEGIANIFAENGTFTVIDLKQQERSNTGRANLLKSFKEGLAATSPRPYIHNHVIELKGNGRATGRCYLDLRTARDNFKWAGAGWYDDEYVKVGDEWKFQTRRFHHVHMEPR